MRANLLERLQKTMADSPATTAATTAATATAAKAAKVAADKAANALPTVVETTEVALQVPSKIVMKQRLVVTASILGGAALGAGVFYGVTKFLNRNKTVVVVPNSPESETTEPVETL